MEDERIIDLYWDRNQQAIVATSEKYGEMSPEFRKEFSLKGAVKKATATVTTMGVYNLYVNGKKAGTAVLAPYWTSYPARVQEQEYDITNLLADPFLLTN